MAAGDLTTVSNVKTWLGITANGDDALLTRLVTAASEYVQQWLNRTFASTSYTETRDGTGGQRLTLANDPITAVASVSINGVAIPASTGYGVAGYAFDRQSIVLTGYTFTRGLRNVSVTYTAGYASTPPEIEQAVIDMIALRYRERDRVGYQSKSLAGETVTFYIGDMPKSTQTILDNWRKVRPVA